MKCPFCNFRNDKVLDSRESKDGKSVRRRRECLKCSKRFTTYEQVEQIMPVVVKKDGRRETFDRFKILNGIKKACEKRPVSMAAMENVVQEIEKEVHNRMDKEINGKDLGDLVMVQLKKLDHVAYVRFASVYRQFKDIGEFVDEIKKLLG
ncbi:MAG: transcriptional regulator NrdR [Candidatus Firestonebacteria bacterium RIFOXYC2_FULL_39_67]|nr:MAG: transcriptional regulator NrdR [Candidatus Firestonebacteria bacterium RIFOXYD2_FULL_39_29]OGF52814.1 MAG: transcriptional regulator NrdR [Candidatus Firestonebacteria bacterium RifOxyC12_full_39_7]OGF57439.1 MAG: transcriptional regulator NrdR [Candidatus Firestonebacteria bacterium RIFOXYC2_FULL_39_67]